MDRRNVTEVGCFVPVVCWIRLRHREDPADLRIRCLRNGRIVTPVIWEDASYVCWNRVVRPFSLLFRYFRSRFLIVTGTRVKRNCSYRVRANIDNVFSYNTVSVMARFSHVFSDMWEKKLNPTEDYRLWKINRRWGFTLYIWKDWSYPMARRIGATAWWNHDVPLLFFAVAKLSRNRVCKLVPIIISPRKHGNFVAEGGNRNGWKIGC